MTTEELELCARGSRKTHCGSQEPRLRADWCRCFRRKRHPDLPRFHRTVKVTVWKMLQAPTAGAATRRVVWKFCQRLRRENASQVKPNPWHYAFVEMEKRWGKNFTLVTQNVDGPHIAAAGNQNIRSKFTAVCGTRAALSVAVW